MDYSFFAIASAAAASFEHPVRAALSAFAQFSPWQIAGIGAAILMVRIAAGTRRIA